MSNIDDDMLQLLETDLQNKKEEIKEKMQQWERLNTKIDEVLEKIRERKSKH